MRRDGTQILSRLQRAKSADKTPDAALGAEMVTFFKKTVQQRQTKLAKIAECWAASIPEKLCDHCTLNGLNRGTLTVLVDSASHLYELKQLMLAGLSGQILFACRSQGLRKIALRPGRPEKIGAGRCVRDGER